MIVITLGTQASGSTWLFNVTLSLFEAAGRPVFSCYADDGLDLLDKMPLDVGDAVIKAHALDQRLLRIARLTGATILVSTRDPLDSVVSQNERFGTSVREAVSEICRSFATIRSLPRDLPVLEFSYENRFTERLQSVSLIAGFIGINVKPTIQSRIFNSFVPHKVKALIATRLAGLPTDVEPSHDPITHWHPRHVGDGRTGKWLDRLEPDNQSLVKDCLSPFASSSALSDTKLRWPSKLFYFSCQGNGMPFTTILCTGNINVICWGPYLHLPSGRWRATPELRSDVFSGVKIEVDVFSPWTGRRLTQDCGKVSVTVSSELALEFDHLDHYEPLELRIQSVEGSYGALEFLGWQLEYLHPLKERPPICVSLIAA